MAHPAESNELPDLQDYVHEVQDECISYLNIPYNKGLFDRGPTLFFHFHFDYDPRPRNLRSRFKICFARRTSWEEYGAWVPGWGGDKREEKRTWDHKVSEDLRKKAGGQWQSRIQMIFTMTPADIGKGPSPGSTYGLSTIVGDTTPSSLDPETAGTNWEKPLKAHLNSGIDARDGITRLAIIAAKLSKNKMWSLVSHTVRSRVVRGT
ncbi:hypothetical protein RQP46_003222 [Phenoliferia psychrophenolica]